MLFDVEAYILKLKHYDLTLSNLEYRNVNPEDIKSFRIHSANMLDDETRDNLDSYLIAKSEITVSHFLQDKHYIPRLLISALVFLLVYFFLSLVVRDPIPMLDELIAALLLSVLTFLGMSKRDIRLARESKLMYDIKKELANAELIQEDYLNSIEEYIYEISSKYSILEISDILSKTDELTQLEDLSFTLPEAFIQIMKSYLHKTNKALDYYLKQVKDCKKRDEKLSARLVRSATNDSLDLYLLAFLFKAGF